MRFVTVWATACLALAACGGADGPAGPAEGETGTVTGPVVEIDSRGLGDVRSFVVRDEGKTYRIVVDRDRDYGFNLGHLNEHRTGGDPVRVRFVVRDGERVALEIEDA